MRRLFGLALAGGLVLASALAGGCSGDDTKFLAATDLAGRDLAGNLPGQDAGTLDGPRLVDAGFMDDGGPQIVVTSPTPNPAQPPLVQYDTLTVTARVTASGAPLDVNSVTITVPISGSTPAPMSLTGLNTYSGSVDISSIPSGSTNFLVSAADTTGRRTGILVDYVHDRGPTIVFTSPTSATAKGSMNVQLVISDPLADIVLSTIQASIRAPNDVGPFTNNASTPKAVVSDALVNFNDPAKFSPALDGPQLITASATNKNGTLGRATKAFTVDNAGPKITIDNPLPGAFVGGLTNIKATITDVSGVDNSTVVAVFGGNPAYSVALHPMMSGSAEYDGQFDVRSLGTSYVSPTLSVRASDKLGNPAELAEEIIVDNTPPRISLHPPLMRVAKYDTTSGVWECSQLFDPVGTETVSDGQITGQMVTFKARVEDRGNRPPPPDNSLLVPRHSGLLASSVVLWAIPATVGTEILAVDTNNDGICDDVNPTLTPTYMVTSSNQAVTVPLSQLVTDGTPDYRGGGVAATPPWNTAGCDTFGDTSTTMAPVPLCALSGTRLTYVLAFPDAAVGNKAIFSIPPILSDPYNCIGLQFDSRNRLPEGPACAVVRAVDNAGNQNVSPPLRICIDRGSGVCAGFTTLPPCTGTYDKRTNTLSATPCTPANMFPSPEVRHLVN